MLFTSKIAHNVILLALSLKTLERAFQRLVLADFDCGHVYTTFVLYRTLISLVIVSNRGKFVNDFSPLNKDLFLYKVVEPFCRLKRRKRSRKTRLKFRKVHFLTAENVNVQMVHGLPRVVALVYNETIAAAKSERRREF